MRLFRQLFGAPAVDAHLSERAHLQALLDVEAALAEAQAALGVVPESAAAAIRHAAQADEFDMEPLAAAAADAGNLIIPLVKALTARVAAADPEAAGWVHWGATSQDIADTAVVLQLRAAGDAVLELLRTGADQAATLAGRYADAPMVGRTWLQHATPVTFGLKAAGWMEALDRVRDRVAVALAGAAVLQLGGASGTMAALGPGRDDLASALGTRLNLPVPTLPWHAHRDRLVDVACALGVAAGTLGKIGRDLALLAQTEVGEAGPAPRATPGSSTMPHKNNPVGAAVAVAAAIRAPGLVATMLAAMPQEHERGVGGWHAEWETMPELVRLVGGAAAAVGAALATLVVDPARMLVNLMRNEQNTSEAVSMALVPHLGRARAHALVAAACRRSASGARSLAEELAADPDVVARLSAAEIGRLLAPTGYLGGARAMVERALRSRRADA